MEKTIVKFTVEQYAEAKEAAKEFGINPVGKKKEVLVQLVNDALEAKANEVEGQADTATQTQPAAEKPKKWYEETPIGVEANDIIQIKSKTIEKAGEIKEILQDRYAKVIGPSPRKGLVRAILLDEKTGKLLNCPITLEVGKFNKVAEDWEFKAPESTEVNEITETPEAEKEQQTA